MPDQTTAEMGTRPALGQVHGKPRHGCGRKSPGSGQPSGQQQSRIQGRDGVQLRQRQSGKAPGQPPGHRVLVGKHPEGDFRHGGGQEGLQKIDFQRRFIL